jgi:hypothetical protein
MNRNENVKRESGRHVRLIAVCSLLSSCTWMQDKMTEPKAERPTPRGEGHLSRESGDPALGPDERLLLAEYNDVQAAKVALEDRQAELTAKIEGLQAELTQTQEARDKERTARAAAEAELGRLRSLVQDRDAKILALHIEKTKQTQELLSLRIEAAERQNGGAAPGESHATPVRGGQ